MEKQLELTKKIGNRVLKPLVILKLLFVLIFFSSPFVWIWHSWELSLKIGLSGIFGAIILHFITSVVEDAIKEIVAEKIDKIQGYSTENKSKFQKKMDEMIKKAEDDKARSN